MYRYSNGQISLADFKQPVGMNLKESSRWVKKAQTIPWPEIEKRYRDECERVEVERRFSLAKRKCGMGLVTAKLRETAAHVIAMSVLVLNLRKIQRALSRMLTYLLEILAQNKNWALVQ